MTDKNTALLVSMLALLENDSNPRNKPSRKIVSEPNNKPSSSHKEKNKKVKKARKIAKNSRRRNRK